MKISAEDIKKVKEIADKNFFESNNDAIGFEFCGTHIINPWVSECGRFDFTDKEAIEYYGLENVLNFILDTLKEEK